MDSKAIDRLISNSKLMALWLFALILIILTGWFSDINPDTANIYLISTGIIAIISIVINEITMQATQK